MKLYRLALVLVAVFALTTVSCGKQQTASENTMEEPAVAEPQPEPQPADPIDTDAIKEDQQRREAMEARNRFLNEYVYFDFDSAVLRSDAMEVLRNKATWLESNAGVMSLVIEGHCDERGTDAYNMALGQKRAEAVQQYLTDLGLDAQRFQIVSYGEERPLDAGHGEESWAKNRRAAFVLN